MYEYRHLTTEEIASLETNGSSASDWSAVEVAGDFRTSQVHNTRFEGRVRLAPGVRIRNARIRNYDIGAETTIEDVTALECRGQSSFGNGTPVATMNENGGRTVRIFEGLTAQTAYIAAIYRHRPKVVAALDRMAETIAEALRSTQGRIGRRCRISGCRLLYEIRTGDDVTIEGAAILSNGTVGDRARIGIDVKAYDFIISEAARIDNGVLVERCFIGECCIFDRGFTASDSLFFANSHCENGEAVSIFAGPCTVSHHKASLLIAGMFSFFNAGSGTNQSNHLFKSGAVHQAVHRRGCKFASGAYVMSPAVEGVYTMIMGRHTHHHDTSVFPFSYLLEQEGRSALLPGANLSSYGTVRDIEKWRQRDRRTVKRDLINFEAWNPFVGNALTAGIAALNKLLDNNPDAQNFIYGTVHIKLTGVRRGLRNYALALAATKGDLLARGRQAAEYDGRGSWIDAAGLYLTRSSMESLLDEIERGEISTPQGIDERLRSFALHYDDYAHSWATDLLRQEIGREPRPEDIARALAEGEAAKRTLHQMTENDRAFDCSLDMAVGYGLDAVTAEEREADFKAVRGL